MLIPELQEFHRLFAQMDILKEKLMRFGSRDTLICDNVLGSGSPTPPGVEFWRIKTRFYPPGHKKNEKRTSGGSNEINAITKEIINKNICGTLCLISKSLKL